VKIIDEKEFLKMCGWQKANLIWIL
jgi:hypothetical protein